MQRPTTKKLLAALCISLMALGTAACEDGTGDEVEDISPELDES